MIIHHPTEFTKSFVWHSTGLAVKNLAALMGGYAYQFEACTWGNRMDSGNWGVSPEKADLLIVEATYFEINGTTVQEVRRHYSNAAIIVLSSDAIYFVATGKNGGFQFQGLGDVDLFLELDPRVREHYRELGYRNIDEWKWTASAELLGHIAGTPNPPFEEREYDFIGVYAPHTIAREGSYRNQMVRAIESAGLKFTQGGGSGHGDSDIDRLIQHYKNSKFTLGTSSHDNPLLTQCVKGFRDFMGPAAGSLLIYDNNPAIRLYNCPMPVHPYGDFDRLISLTEEYKSNPLIYQSTLEAQQKWVLENTIEKQLFKKLKEHKLV